MEGLAIGRIVHYVLSIVDAEAINRRRQHAVNHMEEHRNNATGVQVHVGNTVQKGMVYPVMIIRVWSTNGLINGQVFLDGNDLYWVTSIEFDEKGREGTWHWPEKA